jgi:hypothetical protein
MAWEKGSGAAMAWRRERRRWWSHRMVVVPFGLKVEGKIISK